MYKLTNHLGKGAFASVNKAEHRKSREFFAVKTYNNYKIAQCNAT